MGYNNKWCSGLGKVDTLADSLVDARVCLRIMATTDLHMQVLPYNYMTGQNVVTQGLARTATLIRNARHEVANSILVDNGDFLGATECEAAAGGGLQPCHPMISIMNHLGYDAATPGNHDFDYGLAFLRNLAAQARFPFVSANALHRRASHPRDDHALFARYTILERQFTDSLGRQHSMRIGITGFLPPHSVAQYDNNEHPVQTRDIIEAARAVVPEMKAAGADIIIALAHTGIGQETHVFDMENAVVPLAEVAGIDAIISGHRHQVFPGPDWPESPAIDASRGTIHGKPVVSPGFWGSHLGLIDLELVQRGNKWTLRHRNSEARAVFQPAPVAPDPEVEKIIQPTHTRMLEQIKTPVGRTLQPLNSFFALAAPSRAVQVVQQAQIWYVEQHLADSFDQNLPLLSSACTFKSGGFGGPTNFTNIPAGILDMRAVSDLYAFPNRIELLQINGAGLREWLERAASVFNQAQPGAAAQALKSPEIPAYLFETVLGVDYTINLAQKPRYDLTGAVGDPDNWRIQGLTYQGDPVEPSQKFIMISNNYRLGGGGRYPGCCLENPVGTPSARLPDILPAYFRAHPELDPALEHHWRFAPVAGACMAFSSSPEAVMYLDDLFGIDIRPRDIDPRGYQQFDLVL